MASNRKFNVPINLLSLASNPADADEGDIYYNTTDDRVRVYKNSAWVNLAYADDVGITSIDYITFDTTPEASSTETGTMFWDSGDGLPKVILNANVELGLGQEQVALCKNATGSSIPKGSVVYINGAAGQRPTIALADADTEATSSKTFGLTAETIADGAEGFVVTFGVLRGVNTNGLTEGAAVWLSSTAGGYTTTIPAEPSNAVFIGYVVKANASSGEILINIQNGYELNELHGVSVDATPADNEVLAYDSSSTLWINQTAAEAGLATSSHNHTLDSLSNVTISSNSSGEILKWNGTAWINNTLSEAGIQPLDTELTAIAGLTSAADRLPYFTGSGTASLATFTSFGRSLVDDADAAAARTTLGLGTMAVETASNYLTTSTASSTYLPLSAATANQIIYKNASNVASGSSGLIYDGTHLKVTGNLESRYSSGDEGGEIVLNKPVTNTTITDGVVIDVHQNRLRIFEQGGTNRGVYIDITAAGASVGTNLVGGGSASNSFTTISTPSGTSPVADSSTDTLTLTAGTGITITGDSATDSITIASTITDTNTTYDLTSTGTTTASINLVPSSGGTDSVTITGSGATSVSHSAGAITISSTDTNTTYSAATSASLGLVELFSDTTQATAANAVTSTASRTYGLQLNASNQGVINVPWTDTNTTYDLTSTGTTTASINLVPSSGGTDSITITGSGATSVSHTSGAITVSSTDTDTNYYPSAIVFNAGTTAGPTLDLTMSGAGAPDLTAVAIPSASGSASGIVTTTTQSFAGNKNFSGDVATANLTSLYVGVGSTGIPNTGTGVLSENSAVDSQALRGGETNASYTGNMTRLNKNRASDTSSTFLVCYSSFSGTPDLDAQIRGDGRMSSDLAFVGTGADYAEYFEWLDGNPDNEDRNGKSVSLSGNKIILATESSDSIIGVVSANADIIGDSAWNNWQGRWITDSFNRRVQEEYNVWQWEKEVNGTVITVAYEEGFIPEDETVPEIYSIVIQTRDKQNPEWNSEEEYVPREYRKEWSTIGLLGKIRIYKGQPVNPRWIKMRDIDEQVEEWLVR